MEGGSGEKVATIYRFFVQQSGKEQKVQDVGLRAQIISSMLEFGFEKGDAINQPDSQSVEVLVESDNLERVQEFKEKLKKTIETEAQSKYSTLPKKVKITKVEKVQNPPTTTLPALNTKANSLMLAQTTKGVGVMTTGFEGLRREMTSGFEGLRRESSGLKEEFSKMSEYLRKYIEGNSKK